MKTRTILVAGAAMISILAPVAAEAACTTLTSSPGSIVIDYDPLSAVDTIKTFTITQTNDCGQGRSMRFGLANYGYEGVLPSETETQTTRLQSAVVVTDSGIGQINLSQSSQRKLLSGFAISGTGQSETRTVSLRVPRGLTIPASERTFDLYLQGEERKPGGAGANNPTESLYRILPITLSLVESVSMTLPGAGASTTMNFGQLETGARKDVNVQINSTGPFRVTLASENNGALKLLGAAGNWTIPYAATLNGIPIAANAPITSPAPSGPLAGQVSWRFEVTVGDVAGARAGIYRDIVTLKVLAL